MLTRLVFLLSVALSIPAVAADPQLPPEGSWSRYYVQHLNYGGDESNYELVLKWLGSITVDGEKCRWIEIDYPENKSVPIPHTGATKLAIPEKLILSGKKLISDQTPGIHYYQQHGGDPEIATIAEKRNAGTVFVHDMMFGTYLQFLPGPRQAAKLTESQVKVPYARGELISKQAYSGKREGDFIDSVNIRNHWENTYKIQTHDEIPFGFVSAEFEWETSFPDHTNTGLEVSEHWVRKEIWTLQDFGVGAKSSIPNRE
ncbi:MAG TPA: hypothetical protein VLA12_21095 [Planctomycetaceae bacterium]|nr:hypothetical protein [Planctomycetaceae bacterium]